MCLLLTTLKLYPGSDRDAEIKGSISAVSQKEDIQYIVLSTWRD